MRVFRSLSTYTPGTFEGWLHRITTNLFLDQARRKQRIRFDALSDERASRLTSALAESRRGVRRPDLRRRHRAGPGHAAAGLPRRGRALRRRGPVLRRDRRDPRRQARHGPVPDPPRPRHAPQGVGAPRAPGRPVPLLRTRHGSDPHRVGYAVIGHLGSRVSALLDGQMSAEEAERAWAHVHACHLCRDLVEHEGWVKTRLAGLSFGDTPTPDRLKGSLLGVAAVAAGRPAVPLVRRTAAPQRRARWPWAAEQWAPPSWACSPSASDPADGPADRAAYAARERHPPEPTRPVRCASRRRPTSAETPPRSRGYRAWVKMAG